MASLVSPTRLSWAPAGLSFKGGFLFPYGAFFTMIWGIFLRLALPYKIFAGAHDTNTCKDYYFYTQICKFHCTFSPAMLHTILLDI